MTSPHHTLLLLTWWLIIMFTHHRLECLDNLDSTSLETQQCLTLG